MATYNEDGSDYVPGESNDRAVAAEPPVDEPPVEGATRRPTAPGRPTHPVQPPARPGHVTPHGHE
jgi:hypothetical protein